MRRFYPCVIATLLLFSCGRSGGLSSKEVLSKATLASQDLLSAHLEATLDVSGSPGEGGFTHFALRNAVIQNGGKQLQGTLVANGSDAQNGARLETELLIAGPGEVYVHPNEAVLPFNSLDPAPYLGSWWKVPGSGASISGSVTPDPRLLRAQAEAVNVDRDLGMDLVNGKKAYHYAVSLDGPKLMRFLQLRASEQGGELSQSGVDDFLKSYDAKGEMWIDADTFFIHHLLWTITTKDTGSQLRLDVQLSQHNAAPVIVPPAASQPFPASVWSRSLTLLQVLLPQSLPQTETGSSGSGFTLFLE